MYVGLIQNLRYKSFMESNNQNQGFQLALRLEFIGAIGNKKRWSWNRSHGITVAS